MRHGEVWSYGEGGRHKAVVVSADGYNVLPDARALVVPLLRRHGQQGNPFLVATNEADPVTGIAVVPEVGPTPVPRELLGMATGATMAALAEGLRVVFDL